MWKFLDDVHFSLKPCPLCLYDALWSKFLCSMKTWTVSQLEQLLILDKTSHSWGACAPPPVPMPMHTCTHTFCCHDSLQAVVHVTQNSVIHMHWGVLSWPTISIRMWRASCTTHMHMHMPMLILVHTHACTHAHTLICFWWVFWHFIPRNLIACFCRFVPINAAFEISHG